jgi:hypothetical protein
MIRKIFPKIPLVLFMLFLAATTNGQIYNADFRNNGDGFADHTTTSPPEEPAEGPETTASFGVDPNSWNLSYETAPETDASANSFKTSGGSLVSSDWGGVAKFQSTSIDISMINVVNISAITENNNANDGVFNYFYILDDTRVDADNIISVNEDTLDYSILNLDVSGNTSLIVGFEFSENGGGQGYTTSLFTVTEVKPIIGFDDPTSSETEKSDNFTVTIPITVSDYANTQIDINVTATSGTLETGTAENGDFTFTSPTALTFTENGSQTITVGINADADRDSETFTLTITETSDAFGLTISQKTHTVTITDDGVGTIWNGSINSDWATAGNWSHGLPLATSSIVIEETGIAPVIFTNTNAEVNNITISELDGLTISGGSLTIEGDLTINTGSELTLESRITAANTIDAATVIVKGNYTSVDFNKFTYFTETFNDNTSGWTLVSSPTAGNIEDFTLFNDLQTNDSNFGIAPFIGGNITVWDYYTGANPSPLENEGGFGDNELNEAGDFINGKGYSVLPNSALNTNTAKGKLRFKGAMPTTNIPIEITDSSNSFNLIGNPYPSFISANTFLGDASTQLSEQTIWFWDKTNAEYITVNNTSNRFISPAQGFFVKSKTGGGTVTFTEAMQSHQLPLVAVFNRIENVRPEIQLNITTNGISKNAAIYYYDNKSTGFDNGYDSSVFAGIESSLAVYTKLVSSADARNLAIQTLPTSNYETMVIPVGVKATENSEITFSASALHLPEGFNLYLEDRVHNTVTRLDTENSEYKTTVIKNTTEGRFYLHTKTKAVLNTQTAILNTVSFFKTSNNNLKITGLQKGKTTVSLFNILGKNIMNTSFEASSVKNIALPNLASGVYIVKLQTEEGSLNKKIILE